MPNIPPPPKLYKYQPYNTQTLDKCKDRRIWFSKPASFNDLFDGQMGYNIEQVTDEEWKNLQRRSLEGNGLRGVLILMVDHLINGKPNDVYKAKVLDGYKLARHIKIDEVKEHGVACFSEQVDNILMWAHTRKVIGDFV